MFKHRKNGPKQPIFVLCVEQLEVRLSPATLDLGSFGSRNPVANTPYDISTVYPAGLGGAMFRGVHQPTAYFPTPGGQNYQVNLMPVANTTAASQTFRDTLAAWNQGLDQADRWTFTYANVTAINNLTFTVNSYEAYGSAYAAWYPVGSNTRVSAGIDVRTNIPDPGVNNTPTYGWIQIVTTNFNPPAEYGVTQRFVDIVGGTSPLYLSGQQGVIPANQKSFPDIAGRAVFTNAITWSAETFLVLKPNPNANALTIYPDGFTWGWTTQARQGPIDRHTLTSIALAPHQTKS